jgi:nitrate reductase NapAB chaperone NapD
MAVAHLLINCQSGKEDSVIENLKKFDTVREVEPVFGAYDIVVKLESPNSQEIRENTLTDIRNINDIVSTVTLFHIDD